MLINGRPERDIPASDRGLAYGDGLFETIRIRRGAPLLWAEHMTRLERGCRILGLECDPATLERESRELLVSESTTEAVLKIILSRGSGGRGYRPPAAAAPTRIIQLSALPAAYDACTVDGIDAMLCQHRLSENPGLAGIKHLNRLDQVLASREMDPAMSEGLMCDLQGRVIEGTRSNLFWVRDDRLYTPRMGHCGVDGVMREWLLNRGHDEGVPATACDIEPGELSLASELFVCNSIFGVWPVRTLALPRDTLQWPVGPGTRRVQQWLRDALDLCSTDS